MFVPVDFDNQPMVIRPALPSIPCCPPEIPLESGVTTDFTLTTEAKWGLTLADLAILTVGELKALDSLERQAARRAARKQPLVQLILRTFVHRGGPIPVEDIIAASPGSRVE